MNSSILGGNEVGMMNGKAMKTGSMFSFYLVVIYLFFEFGRPQNLIPGLTSLHLPALIIILIMLSLFVSRKIYLRDKQTISLLLIMTEMVIHGPLAINNYWAFWTFYLMLINFIAFMGISRLIDSEKKFNNMIDFYLLTFVFLSIMGIVRHGRGIGGFFENENDFCMVLNMVFPFALYRIFTSKNNYGKIYYIALAVLFIVANLTTLSRGGFVGLASVVVYCVIRSKNKFALISVLSILVLIALMFAPNSYWSVGKSITDDNPYSTGEQRLYAWKLGWKMFLDNPILGVGQGNYPWHVVEVENALGVQWQQRSLGGRAAHSMYFTLIPELGLVGIVLYGLLIKYFIKDTKYIKNISKERSDIFSKDESKFHFYQSLAFEASLIAYLVSSAFISTLYYPSLYILCAFVLAYKNILNARVLL
jgi:O-antigen ligase